LYLLLYLLCTNICPKNERRSKRANASEGFSAWALTAGAVISDLLLDWFARSGRALPWRVGRDPYRVLLSETMLQQTQVATVIPYYRKFLEKWPTLQDLAAADESEVLKVWEGWATTAGRAICWRRHEGWQLITADSSPAMRRRCLACQGSANTQPAPSVPSPSASQPPPLTAKAGAFLPG
jgi:hypothetical protein